MNRVVKEDSPQLKLMCKVLYDKMNKKQINEFLTRLEGKEGCNFVERVPGDARTVTWRCKGGNDTSKAKAILTAMKISKMEQDRFLERCKTLGGHCDCEILFNAADRL